METLKGAARPADKNNMTQVTHSWDTVHVGRRGVEVARIGTHDDVAAPLVFLHGWGLSPRAYLPGLTALVERTGREVVALSLPGFGSSDPLPIRSQGVAGVAGHLASALDQLGLSRVDLVGHSFGGGVALRIGAARPDLVSSLVLLCPVGGAGTGAVPLHRMLSGVTRDGFHAWTPRALADLLPAACCHPAAVVSSALACWRADLLPDVAEVSRRDIPTVFLFADRDTVVTPGAIPRSPFPHVRCETVAGHHSWILTEPTRFVTTMVANLAGHPHLPTAA